MNTKKHQFIIAGTVFAERKLHTFRRAFFAAHLRELAAQLNQWKTATYGPAALLTYCTNAALKKETNAMNQTKRNFVLCGTVMGCDEKLHKFRKLFRATDHAELDELFARWKNRNFGLHAKVATLSKYETARELH